MNNVIEEIRCGDIYSLLSQCTNEDLHPIVAIVLSRRTNSLHTNDIYKKYSPNHVKYHKIIGDEIRLFGGNSVRNILRGEAAHLFSKNSVKNIFRSGQDILRNSENILRSGENLLRGGEGPSYSEIVVDVCKKLNVPCAKGDTVGNEANLLDIFVEARWKSLPPAERQRLAEEAREAAADKISIGEGVRTAAKFFMGPAALVFGPAAWAALGISMLDASYKVTVPCVLHIAYLRRRFLEDLQKSRQSVRPQSQTSVPSDRTNALVIAADDGEPVLWLARIPEPSANGAWHRIDASDNGISRLNPLLAAVPSLAVAGEVANTRYMEVVCSGPLVAAKTGGGFRGFSMGIKGVSSHANLYDPSQLAAMVNVSALMNVASIALAQKHLADISRKLGEIKDAIDGIRKFQKDERHSKLTGAIRYFEEVAPAVLEGEKPDRVLHQIERHEAELLQVQEHLATDIYAELESLRNLKDDEWFGSAEAKSAIESHQQRIVELYRELILCLRARSCGWQLLCMFPGEEIGKAHRRRAIQGSLEELATDGKMLKETDGLLRKKIYELSSFWNAENTINERKLTLLKANETLLADVASCRAEVQRDLSAADEMLAALRKPVAMVARIEDGRIAAIRAL